MNDKQKKSQCGNNKKGISFVTYESQDETIKLNWSIVEERWQYGSVRENTDFPAWLKAAPTCHERKINIFTNRGTFTSASFVCVCVFVG